MGHVRDRWTTRDPSTGRKRRNDRWGKGRRWQARWTDAQGRERVQACATEDEALQLLADARAGVAAKPQLSAVTLAVHADRWRAAQLHHRESTRATTAASVRRIAAAFGDVTLGEVTRPMVQGVVTDWAGSYSAATVRLSYSHLHSMLASAVLDGLLEFSPCVGIRLPPKPGPRLWIPTTEQVMALQAAMTPAGRSMVVVAAAIGPRPGELRGLTVGHCQQVVRIVQQVTPTGQVGPPKTRAGVRSVDMGAAAWARVEPELADRDPGEWVWPNARGGALSRSTLADRWRDAAGRAGLDAPRGSGWHSLRHYHASLLIAAGLSPVAVAARLGHASTRETLESYAHLWPTDGARAVAAVEAELPWL